MFLFKHIFVCTAQKFDIDTNISAVVYKEKKIFTLLKSGVMKTLSPTVIKIKI